MSANEMPTRQNTTQVKKLTKTFYAVRITPDVSLITNEYISAPNMTEHLKHSNEHRS